MTHRSWDSSVQWRRRFFGPAQRWRNPDEWRQGEWPHTDFSVHSIDYREIKSGGPPKDGIPAIDQPRFESLKEGQADGWAAGSPKRSW